MLLNFAKRIAWKRVDEEDLAWLLEAGKLVAAEGDQVIRGQLLGLRATHHDRYHLLAEVGMRQAEDGYLGHSRVHQQNLFDLARVHVVAAADDEPARPPRNRVVAVGASPAQVSSVEPAVGVERGGGRIRALPVALEDVRATDLDLARSLVMDRLAGLNVHDPSFLPRERHPDSSRTSLAIVGVGEVHHRLGHSVALEDALSEHLLEFGERLRAERGGSRYVQS